MQQQMQEESSFSFEDLMIICKRLWEKRKYILYVFGAFFVLGFAAAIFQKPVYNSSCVFVPQTGGKSKASSSLSSLASMAGISLGDMVTSEELSPLVYPKILQSVEFNKELMRVPFHYKKWDEPVSMYDLATDKKYRTFSVGAIFGAIKKYTIGLPGVILGAIRGKQPDIVVPEGKGGKKPISVYTKDEYEIAKRISENISMNVEKKDGYITLSCKAGEALVAAELCRAAMDLLQKYVTDFKLSHARSTNDYIEGRYEEAKADYEAKQLALAQFTDANRGAMTATAQVKRDQLLSDYNIAYAMFTEMSKQYLQSEMKVKEDTPVLAEVEPVSVPMKKANSRAKTLFVWCFLGALAAAGSVLGFDWLKKKGINFPKNWE